MLIPQNVAKIARRIPNKTGEPQYSSVLLERDSKGHPHAIVCDTIRLVEVEWHEEDRSEWPKRGNQINLEPREGFSIAIDRETWIKAEKNIPATSETYILRNMAVEEHSTGDNDIVRIETSDQKHSTVVAGKAYDGVTLPWRKILPAYKVLLQDDSGKVKDVEGQEIEEIPQDAAAAVTLDVKLLVDLLQALKEVVGNPGSDDVRIIVPLNQERRHPVVFHISSGRTIVRGALMPKRDEAKKLPLPIPNPEYTPEKTAK